MHDIKDIIMQYHKALFRKMDNLCKHERTVFPYFLRFVIHAADIFIWIPIDENPVSFFLRANKSHFIIDSSDFCTVFRCLKQNIDILHSIML